MNTTIKPKLKICSVCGDSCWKLWTSSPKQCKHCAQMAKLKAGSKEQVTLTQTITGQPAKPFKAIRQISPAQAKRNARYKKVRDPFMEANPVCMAQWEGCTYLSNECHHSEGRIGEKMFEVATFRALCTSCHGKVELNKIRAELEGLSGDRL